MKFACSVSILLLLANSALAFTHHGSTNPDDPRQRRTRGVNEPRGLNYDGQQPKGMMKASTKAAKSAKAPKDDKAPKVPKVPKGCVIKRFKALYSDIDAGIVDNAVGSTIIYPLYDYETGEPIGTYENSSVTVRLEDVVKDCVFSGAFNLGFDESEDFPFTSQIMVSGTCLGTFNSITGGTGEYACASGTELFIDSGDEDIFATQLTICNTCH
jgi:hypothetical protein